MHVAAATAYGLTMWLAMLAYSFMAGEHFWLVFFLCPVIVSTSMGALFLLDWLCSRLLPDPILPPPKPKAAK